MFLFCYCSAFLSLFFYFTKSFILCPWFSLCSQWMYEPVHDCMCSFLWILPSNLQQGSGSVRVKATFEFDYIDFSWTFWNIRLISDVFSVCKWSFVWLFKLNFRKFTGDFKMEQYTMLKCWNKSTLLVICRFSLALPWTWIQNLRWSFKVPWSSVLYFEYKNLETQNCSSVL